jgi:poly(A) polymerase
VRQSIPEKQREFAVEVVRQLRDHGFEAYWAGGCVRDQILKRTPYDYDVATSAQPAEIQRVFHKRKTLAVGAAFGVIAVIGPRGAGQIEVTTFRRDIAYSDGRHPDQVAFSSPEEDAKRRDFTINGMFYDPLAERVIDFVGGAADVRSGIVRAIGKARERFTEDKLRMLRAVRFAAVFNFQLEAATLAAIHEMASQITVVSAERIAAEMRIVLAHEARVRAAQLLAETGLLRAILPEAAELAGTIEWARTIDLLGAVEKSTFPLALAVLLHEAKGENLAEAVGHRWRLARKETDRVAWLLKHRRSLEGARQQRWSQLQPLLINEGAEELIALHAAEATANADDLAFCREQLARPAAELNPPPLLSGDNLIGIGIARGPGMARLLKAVRTAQLDGQARDREAALKLVEQLKDQKS